MKKTVIVTGGAGFVGSNLVKGLIEKNYRVAVIDNLSSGEESNLPKNVWLCTDDIRRVHDTEDFFRSVRREYGPVWGVFHLAALPRVQFSIDNQMEAESVNVTGLINVFESARRIKARRIIYSASSSAYGDQDSLPFHEKMLPNPMSPYARQKLYGEYVASDYARHFGVETVSLRYFNIYGPGANPNGPYAQAIIKFINQRSRGEKMTVTGDGLQTRDSVHVHDVVRANILALESSKLGYGEVINIGSGRDVSVLDMAKMIGGDEYVFIRHRVEPRHTRADIRKAKRLIDWEPTVSLEKGIAELKQIHGIV